MSVVLLDTTVASLLHPKKSNNHLRVKYEPHMQGQTLALSFQSVAELWNWAETNNWGENARQHLDAFIRRFLVIPYDFELARVWARVMAESCKSGRRLEAGDCWIMATAVHRGIPLLVHDNHFINRTVSGLEIITYCNEPQVG